jgi:multidrug efflux pump subunit AcrA (membrane-fusion protein)
MKIALTLGVAVTAMTLAAASANTTSHTRTVIRHGGPSAINMDADNDGWLTRAEAAAAAERNFDEMDTNNDGRLTSEDRPQWDEIRVNVEAPDIDIDLDGPGVHRMEFEDENGDRRVIIRRGELSEAEEARIEREVERAMAQAERAQAAAERAAARAEAQADRASRNALRAARDAERSVSREVIVIRADGDDHHMVAPRAPVAPHPPHAPRAPMFMMLVANSEEADTNGDGALSREEFRAQQLRFFDASDANGDGRIRFEAPPAPPEPPVAPTPPEPPRRR